MVVLVFPTPAVYVTEVVTVSVFSTTAFLCDKKQMAQVRALSLPLIDSYMVESLLARKNL